MASSSDEILVRKALPGDKSGVVAINEDIYAGLDYLPHRYDSWMSDDQFLPHVAIVQSKVVGFEVYFVNKNTEDGKAEITSCANRVNEEFQGIGVLRKMKEAMKGDLETLYPGHRILALARNPADYWTSQIESGKWRLLQAWGLCRCKIPFKYQDLKSVLYSAPSEFSPANSHMQSLEATRNRIRSHPQDITQMIATYGRYLICGNPWLARQALDPHSLPFLDDKTPLMSLSQDDIDGTVNGFSLYTPYLAKAGHSNHLFFYGESVEVAMQHAIVQLRNNIEDSKADTRDNWIYLHFPPCLKMSQVLEAMGKLFKRNIESCGLPEVWLLQKNK